jgi:hypothetical protein
MGLGGTYLLASERITLFGNGCDRNYERGFSGNMIFGFRSEPVTGGFLFRANFTSFFGYGIFWLLFGGLSVG